MVALPALREVLARPDFRKLWSVRLVGQFSDGLLQAALTTFVLFSPERQPDAVKVAAAFAILYLPYSVIGPFAGVFLDRWRRRNVLVRANLLKSLVTLPIVALVFAGNDGLWLGVSVLAVLGIGRFVLAGLSASLPHVVDGRDLVTANALTPTSGTIAAAIGALLGVNLRGVLLGLIDGVRVLGRNRIPRRAITVVGMHRIAFGILTAGALLLVRETFNEMVQADSALGQFAIITAAAAIGALLGAVLTPGATRRFGAVRWSAFALLQAGTIGAVLIFIGAMAPAFIALLGGALSMGFAGQSVKVCSDTLIQRHIPDDHLGRIFALFDMIVNVALVLGITLMALLAPKSGQAPWAYAGVGVLLIATATWYLTGRGNRLPSTATSSGQ